MARRDKGNYLAASADCAPTFCWLGSAMPTWLDLRQCGWTLSNDSQPGLGCTGVFHVSDTDQAEAMKVLLSTPAEKRREVLVIGIEPARERAALLQVGFGDVMSRDIALDELRARARRLFENSRWLPRHRHIGALELDLLAREAFGFGKALNLNPREFALLWRLAESLDLPVSKEALVRDVWRMGFVPETNSIAVHMSRLRRKLSLVGLAGIIETSPLGGYRLRAPDGNHDIRRVEPRAGENRLVRPDGIIIHHQPATSDC